MLVFNSRAMGHAVIAGLLPQRPGFDPRSVYARFMAAKVAPGHAFHTVGLLRFLPCLHHQHAVLTRPTGEVGEQNALA
jgi:hypothetical protein